MCELNGCGRKISRSITISSWYLQGVTPLCANDCLWGYCLPFTRVGLERLLLSLKGWYCVCLYRGISLENSIEQSLGMAGHLRVTFLTYFFFLSPEVKVFKNKIYTDFCSSWNWTCVNCCENGEDWVTPLLQEKTDRLLTMSSTWLSPSWVHKITHTQPLAGLWTLSWTHGSRALILS